MHTSACSSCGKAIIWTSSPTGARLPLDARPVSVYHVDESDDPPNAVKLINDTALYVSHFVTCPSVEQHTRSRR